MESAGAEQLDESLGRHAGPGEMGRPPGTVPMVATPCAEIDSAALATMAPMTASSAQGTRCASLAPSTITSEHGDRHGERGPARAGRCPAAQLQTSAGRLAGLARMPNMPRELPAGHLDADAGEEADEHRAREEVGEEAEAHESRQQQQRAGESASMPASATYCGEPAAASPARPATMIAAVAESAPTTRCRDEPSTAKSASGSRIV